MSVFQDDKGQDWILDIKTRYWTCLETREVLSTYEFYYEHPYAPVDAPVDCIRAQKKKGARSRSRRTYPVYSGHAPSGYMPESGASYEPKRDNDGQAHREFKQS